MAKYFQVVDLVLAPFRPMEGMWEDTESRKWVSMADKDLKTMVEYTIECIKDRTTPKNILVMFFQKFLGGTSQSKIQRYMDQIVDEAKGQRWTKVCFSTAWFTPTHEKIWADIGDYNMQAHLANESLKVSRVNLHKALMSPVTPGSYKLRNRFAMWLEAQLGLSLGLHLSYEGMVAVIRQVKRALDKAFSMGDRKESTREADSESPPSLSVTPGWCRNKFMRQTMARKGLIPDERRRGERSLTYSSQRMRGSENWFLYKEHGSLNRFQQREGMCAAMIHLQKKVDMMPLWGENGEPELQGIVINDRMDMGSMKEGEQGAEQGILDDENAPYDPEEAWTANKDLEVTITNELAAGNEVHSDDAQLDIEEVEEAPVFTDEEMEVVEPEKEKERAEGLEKSKDKETEKEKVCNEDENSSDVEWLLKRLRTVERKYRVEKEKSKEYKSTVQAKELALVKERAVAKLYKQQSEDKEKKIDELEQEVQRVAEAMKFQRINKTRK